MKTIVFLMTAICVAAGAFGQEIVAANATWTSQDIVGVWRVLGERPTAEGRAVPLDTTARISPSGNGIAVYLDGKALIGEYRGGQLGATQETSTAATGRSGKGRTHVGQVWDLSLVATAPDRLEGRFSVTHSGFQAAEASKNGVQSTYLTLTRLDDGAIHPGFDRPTAAARPGTTEAGYAYIAWQYAESSASDIDVLIRCDALGLDKVVRRGERGIVKAGAGDYRLLLRDINQGPRDQPNWNDQYLTLYVEHGRDMSIVISTNSQSNPRAAVVTVLVHGNEIVREYLWAN